MDDIRMVLGLNLRASRTRRGLTQEALRDATGVSQQYLSGLEAGKRNPTIGTLSKVAAALGIDEADLLRRNAP
jgi:transcriptional regulator with XRE-family HTH domain